MSALQLVGSTMLVGVGLALIARLLGRSWLRSLPKKKASSSDAKKWPAERPASGKRTTFVTDEEWQYLSEFKAEVTGEKGETLVARELAHLGLPALHDVILSDTRGLTQIDHLVLGPDAIFVLETKNYAGFVTGSPHGPDWIQELANGAIAHSFRNPLRQNHRHRSAVLEVLSELAVPVRAIVVSAGSARFCDELAGVVVRVECLPAAFERGISSGVDGRLLSIAWDRLRQAAAAGELRREEHLAAVKAWRGRAA